jgi:predicted RNA binding protein YcfA (HicA-like mRNA interferase family)
MPKNIPSLKPKELIKLLEQAGCTFHREGKGDHCLYTREVDGKRRVVPIDIGAREMSPGYVLRIFRHLPKLNMTPDKTVSYTIGRSLVTEEPILRGCLKSD